MHAMGDGLLPGASGHDWRAATTQLTGKTGGQLACCVVRPTATRSHTVLHCLLGLQQSLLYTSTTRQLAANWPPVLCSQAKLGAV